MHVENEDYYLSKCALADVSIRLESRFGTTTGFTEITQMLINVYAMAMVSALDTVAAALIYELADQYNNGAKDAKDCFKRGKDRDIVPEALYDRAAKLLLATGILNDEECEKLDFRERICEFLSNKAETLLTGVVEITTQLVNFDEHDPIADSLDTCILHYNAMIANDEWWDFARECVYHGYTVSDEVGIGVGAQLDIFFALPTDTYSIVFVPKELAHGVIH
ncbi:MAG: hypothetical protein ACRDDY_14020 [Clostridium sp.]